MKGEMSRDKFKTNPFALKYKAKNEARTRALAEAHESNGAKKAIKGIHKSLRRKESLPQEEY